MVSIFPRLSVSPRRAWCACVRFLAPHIAMVYSPSVCFCVSPYRPSVYTPWFIMSRVDRRHVEAHPRTLSAVLCQLVMISSGTLYLFPVSESHAQLTRARPRDVVAQAQKQQGSSLKAQLPYSQSKFETGCFQAGVELAPPQRDVVPGCAHGPTTWMCLELRERLDERTYFGPASALVQ